jgi:hypothetical protein
MIHIVITIITIMIVFVDVVAAVVVVVAAFVLVVVVVVIVAVVTSPIFFPAFCNFACSGTTSPPSGSMFSTPLFTRRPPPHALAAAAESVTQLFAENVSAKHRTTGRSRYNLIQFDSSCTTSP